MPKNKQSRRLVAPLATSRAGPLSRDRSRRSIALIVTSRAGQDSLFFATVVPNRSEVHTCYDDLNAYVRLNGSLPAPRRSLSRRSEVHTYDDFLNATYVSTEGGLGYPPKCGPGYPSGNRTVCTLT